MNFYIDFFSGSDNSLSRIKVREALNTSINIPVITCPTYAMILDETIKNEGIERQQLIIKDISEVL